jgi:hypothetical protein
MAALVQVPSAGGIDKFISNHASATSFCADNATMASNDAVWLQRVNLRRLLKAAAKIPGMLYIWDTTGTPTVASGNAGSFCINTADMTVYVHTNRSSGSGWTLIQE